MNLDRVKAIYLVNEILSKRLNNNSTKVIFAPSFVYLHKISELCTSIKNFSVAAQDCSAEEYGAFTGEISTDMLASCNVDYVIVGHSERRIKFNESNQELQKKVERAIASKLKVIFCCGESLNQRDEGVHFEWIRSQISDSLFNLSKEEMNNIMIAYEPIWAIGTGVTATANQAQEMHSFIRDILFKRYGNTISDNIPILYGGSCNSSNAEELFSQRDINGGLVGGASLITDEFLSIINSF